MLLRLLFLVVGLSSAAAAGGFCHWDLQRACQERWLDTFESSNASVEPSLRAVVEYVGRPPGCRRRHRRVAPSPQRPAPASWLPLYVRPLALPVHAAPRACAAGRLPEGETCDDEQGPLRYFLMAPIPPVVGCLALLLSPWIFYANADATALHRLLSQPRVLLVVMQAAPAPAATSKPGHTHTEAAARAAPPSPAATSTP